MGEANELPKLLPPDGSRKHVAMFAYRACAEDELSLAEGEVVWVSADQSGVDAGWVRGRREGAGVVGLFPLSYVRRASLNADTDRDVSASESSDTFESDVTASNSDTLTDTHTDNHTDRQSDTQTGAQTHLGEVESSTVGDMKVPVLNVAGLNEGPGLYEALYTYESSEPTDLTFSVGEIIMVTRTEGSWWTGSVGGGAVGGGAVGGWRSGVFPSNYVRWLGSVDPCGGLANGGGSGGGGVEGAQRCQGGRDRSGGKTSTPERVGRGSGGKGEAGRGSGGKGEVGSGGGREARRGSGAGGREVARAIAKFEGTGPEQLGLEVGQLVVVRQKKATGWWEGRLEGGCPRVGGQRSAGFPLTTSQLRGKVAYHRHYKRFYVLVDY